MQRREERYRRSQDQKERERQDQRRDATRIEDEDWLQRSMSRPPTIGEMLIKSAEFHWGDKVIRYTMVPGIGLVHSGENITRAEIQAFRDRTGGVEEYETE